MIPPVAHSCQSPSGQSYVNIESHESVTGSPSRVVAKSFADRSRGEKRREDHTRCRDVVIAFPPASAISFALHSSLSLSLFLSVSLSRVDESENPHRKAEAEQKEEQKGERMVSLFRTCELRPSSAACVKKRPPDHRFAIFPADKSSLLLPDLRPYFTSLVAHTSPRKEYT